jgi:tryptophanyl-tRNA synthetase
MTTMLSGVKPTGTPHLGNYFGMIGPAIADMNASSGGNFLFIADVHALNSRKDPTFIREKTYEVAATYIALGLDLNKTILYRQSDMPEVFELSSILTNFTPKGLMNRAHAYKAAFEKDGSDDNVNMGLYTYPILMAADILVMDADVVPVGPDQKQHIEITRDIAGAFNAQYGKAALKLPIERIQKELGDVPGLDGRKMSKSYGNTIPIFSTPDEVAALVAKIPTDSLGIDEPKKPDSPLALIMKLFGMDTAPFLKGGVGYGEAKKNLASIIASRFAPVREKYADTIKDRTGMDKILADGAALARNTAMETLRRVREAIGFK